MIEIIPLLYVRIMYGTENGLSYFMYSGSIENAAGLPS